MFDEGRLGDSHGRVIDFRNTIIILTSNIGGQALYGEEAMRMSAQERTAAGLALVQKHFAPEFVNRIDEIIVFNPLSMESIRQICRIQLDRARKLLQESRAVQLVVLDGAEELLATRGYQPAFGARPLKRLIQRELMDPLASLILEVRGLT